MDRVPFLIRSSDQHGRVTHPERLAKVSHLIMSSDMTTDFSDTGLVSILMIPTPAVLCSLSLAMR